MPEQEKAVDLPPSSFPFRMRILDKETREVLWEHIVRGIGPVNVPGFNPRVVLAEVTYPNGHQHIEGPGVEEFRIVPPPRL